MAAKSTDLPTRVEVLEVGLRAMQVDQTAFRAEQKEAMGYVQRDLRTLLDRQTDLRSNMPKPTNWFAVISAIGTTVAVIASIFALAEWRMTAGVSPVIGRVEDAHRQIREIYPRLRHLEIENVRPTAPTSAR